MQIINLTPHAISVSDINNDIVTYEPSGSIVRMSTKSYLVDQVNGIDIVTTKVTGSNLPAQQNDTYLLVSSMVREAFPERFDLLSPDTNKANRNDKGHIISVPGFVTNSNNPKHMCSTCGFEYNSDCMECADTGRV